MWVVKFNHRKALVNQSELIFQGMGSGRWAPSELILSRFTLEAEAKNKERNETSGRYTRTRLDGRALGSIK